MGAPFLLLLGLLSIWLVVTGRAKAMMQAILSGA